MRGDGVQDRTSYHPDERDRCCKLMSGWLGALENIDSREVRGVRTVMPTVLVLIAESALSLSLWGKVGGTDDHMTTQRK